MSFVIRVYGKDDFLHLVALVIISLV